MTNTIHINGLLGMLKDVFAKLAFESVEVRYNNYWDHEEKEYRPSVRIVYETKDVNPNNNKYGDYLTVQHTFDPLQYGDEKKLASKKGLVMESVERIIHVAVEVICNYGANANYVSRVI